MTQTIPPRLEGQIQAPNRLELFWDSHKRKLYALGILAIVAVAASYVWQYMRQQKVDLRWSAFAESANFDEAYTQEGTTASTFRNPQYDQMMANWQRGWIQGPLGYSMRTSEEVLTQLGEHFAAAKAADLDRAQAELTGTAAEPLLLWLRAVKAREEQRWDDALARLDELERSFPKHFLCISTQYPVQFRPAVEPPKPKDGEKPPPRPRKPELEPAVQGKSAVAWMRDQIAAERQFRAEHGSFYQAPEPDADSPTVRVETTEGTFKIRFYKSKAPKAVESFLRLVGEKWYDGMNVHEIKRSGTTNDLFGQNERPSEFSFGLPASKDPDRSKWITTEKSANILEFEETGISHFPYMVAFAPEEEGKSSSGERIWINATDAAQAHDGQRVVFGRVVEGQEVVDRITQSLFATTVEDERGEGKPQTDITIKSVTIEQ
jgi:cyclophilin family peptidyl-prolyl cis-trans isomerase